LSKKKYKKGEKKREEKEQMPYRFLLQSKSEGHPLK
jgi:hypothetical protein